MLKTVLMTVATVTILGGCIGAPGPVAYRTELAPGVRTVRVPTTLTGIDGQASVLILGVQ